MCEDGLHVYFVHFLSVNMIEPNAVASASILCTCLIILCCFMCFLNDFMDCLPRFEIVCLPPFGVWLSRFWV